MLLGFPPSICFRLGVALLVGPFLRLSHFVGLGSRDPALRSFQCLAEFRLCTALLIHLLGDRLR